MRKAAIRAALTRSVVARGFDAAGQVGAAASEMVRTRRDPALVAERRRLAARRRVEGWGLGTAIALASTAGVTVAVVHQGISAMYVFYVVLAVAVLLWCGSGLVRAGRDLRARTRTVAALPPPQPARRAVARAIQPEIDRLAGYSDSLRHLVGMIGVTEDPTLGGLRSDVLTAADAAEVGLRRAAAELTGVLRARRDAPVSAVDHLDGTAAALTAQIRAGVQQYGGLVTATTETVAASRTLQTSTESLGDVTDRLRALAIGLREIAPS